MRGRAIPLTRPRRLIVDLLHFAAGVPSVPVQRRMDLGPVAIARRAAADRPAWTAIFAKGFALVAAEVPALRRAYCKFPRPHLYECPASVATIMVERDYGGEPAVLGLRVKDPARRTLADLSGRVRWAAAAPVESIRCFRRPLRMAGWPRWVRRPVWWFGLNVGRWRAKHFGTFGVSVYSSLGAESLHPLSPLTATLNYGPIGDDGAVDVRLTYDHRVLDGATVARALARLERVLNTTVCAELLRQAAPPAAGRAA
ncbi:MAG: 2-oxo acid dehydrogenase subunit E2 [Gemmataceae bacterium]|nr:2-oxo acid dehydrogenase subunit E2 [Gemmataceae bacterium]